MQKKVFIILFIILVLLVSGQQKCSPGAKKDVVGERYIGGIEGIVADFVEEEPPESVLDEENEPFTITLLLENKGEHDVNEGDIKTTLSGIDRNSFSISSLTKVSSAQIEGKRKDDGGVIEGGVDYITYDANYKEDLSADFPTVIGVNYCYDYESNGVSTICLRKNAVARARDSDQCIINEDKAVSSSGAPIQITSFKEKASSTSEVSVTFIIENKGVGTAYNKGSFSGDCVETLERTNKDYVHVKINSQGLDIKCSRFSDNSEGDIRLVDGLATVTCRINTAGLQETTYTAPLDINVGYVYMDLISKNIVIENSI